MIRFAPTLPRAPHRLFFVLSMLIGGMLVLAAPPLATPDERAHFTRIVAYAHGSLWSDYQARAAYQQLLDATKKQGEKPQINSAQLQKWLQLGTHVETQNPRRYQAPQDKAAYYAPFVYAPAIVTVALLEQIAAPAPLILLYVARFSLLFAACWLMSWAIKNMALAAWPLALAMLWPSAVWQRSVLSADALMISFAAAFVAITLGQGRIGKWLQVLLLLATGLGKLAYAAYALLVFTAEYRQQLSEGRKHRRLLLLLAVLLGAGGWWLLQTLQHASPAAAQQWALLLQSPADFVLPLVQTLAHERFWRNAVLQGMVGQWAGESLALPFEASVFAFAAAMLLLFLKIEAFEPPKPRSRVIAAFSFLCSIVSVFIGLLLVRNEIGSTLIYGFDGRYLLPLVPLFMMAFWVPKKLQFRFELTYLVRAVAWLAMVPNGYLLWQLAA